jgi:uncharacterized protein YceK
MCFRKILLIVATLLSLQGCGMVEDLAGMQAKMQTINAELKKELGMTAQVGWNIHNGTLTQVTVYIEGDSIEEKTLGQLRDTVIPLLEQHFEEAPEMWIITAAFEGNPS